MGWVALAGAVVQAAGQISSSNAQQVQLNLEKRQEQSAARDREVQRQRRLNAILGAQSAAIAASGVANSGSVANVSLIDAKRAAEDSQVDRINTSSRVIALDTNRRAIRKVGQIQAAGTLLSAAGRYAERGSVPTANIPKVTTKAATQADSGLTGGLQRYA
jgi:hypothetical protein